MSSRLYSSIVLFSLILLVFVSAEPLVNSENVKASLKDSSNEVLEKQVSGSFGTFTQKLFNYDSVLTLNISVILYVLLIMIFIVLLNVAVLVPFIEGGWKGLMFAAVVSLIIAVSGAFSTIISYLSFLAQTFTENWTNVVLLVIALVITIIVSVLSSFLKNISHRGDATHAEITGMKLGRDVALAKKLNDLD